MVDFKALNGVVLIIASVARAASVAHLLDTLAECGDGVCETETECATGDPSLCMPSEVAGGDNDTALAYTEVIGYGRPVVPFEYVPRLMSGRGALTATLLGPVSLSMSAATAVFILKESLSILSRASRSSFRT
ncbi:hypothetical protein CPB85DRAFT_1252632 [Mucidula mucida]|nr:hypothetical protein CPB85DRAFT_1252632 [Mucidula mucida]